VRQPKLICANSIADFEKDVFQYGGVAHGIFQSTYLKQWYREGFNTAERNARMAEKYPDKLIVNGRFDPREGEAGLKQLEEDAKKWNLKTIADLAAHSPDVKFGAPSEFQTRTEGLPGLKAKYGLDIAPNNFVAISDGGGPATVRALIDGTVTAADIFSTSPAIPQNKLVVLEDPKNNFLAANVVPLVSRPRG